MPESKDTAEFEAAEDVPNVPGTTAEADFAEDPAEEGQKASQSDSTAEDGLKAVEAEKAAQAKAAELAEAEKAVAEAKIAAEKVAPEKAAAEQPKVAVAELVETQDHINHPSRHHVAGRPCPAGPQ